VTFALVRPTHMLYFAVSCAVVTAALTVAVPVS
jgi:hypothetical protein